MLPSCVVDSTEQLHNSFGDYVISSRYNIIHHVLRDPFLRLTHRTVIIHAVIPLPVVYSLYVMHFIWCTISPRSIGQFLSSIEYAPADQCRA